MNIIKATPDAPILLGRQGEKNVTRVEFDLLLFVQQYGEGTARLLVKRAGEAVVYPADVIRTGNTAVWDIGEEWTATAGRGYCELNWYVGDKLAKSETFATSVQRSIEGEAMGETPDPAVSYVAQVMGAAARAEAAATDAEGYTSHPTIVGENGNWWAWDGEKYVDSGKTAAGGAVLYTEQTLTDEQKAQARDNIGANDDLRYSSQYPLSVSKGKRDIYSDKLKCILGVHIKNKVEGATYYFSTFRYKQELSDWTGERTEISISYIVDGSTNTIFKVLRQNEASPNDVEYFVTDDATIIVDWRKAEIGFGYSALDGSSTLSECVFDKNNTYFLETYYRTKELETATEKIEHNALTKKIGKNIFDKNSNEIIRGAFVNSSGGLTTNEYSSIYYASGFIEVEPETTYALTDYRLGGARVCFYDAFKRSLSTLIGSDNLVPAKGIFTTPSNTKYLRLSGRISEIDSNQLEKGNAITSYEPYTDYYPSLKNEIEIEKIKNSLPTMATKDNVTAEVLADGESIEIDVPHIKQNNQIAFYGKVEELGTISIGHGFTKPYASAFVEINDTTVKVYTYDTSKYLKAELTHGLTITDFISVIIRVKDDLNAELLLSTTGGAYTQSISWNGCYGPVKAIASEGSLTDCNLSFYCEDYKKPIWAYGDSYFDMWPPIINSIGVSNWLVDGFSGRTSVVALESLKKGLRKATPKMILWCLGMNDRDSSTTINSDWVNTIEELKVICENNNITLILCTIPNTPIRDNTFKNDYVKSSGYRYVDISRAVGAEQNTAWYNGLLSADNVHPSLRGRQVIAHRFLADVPELLDNK